MKNLVIAFLVTAAVSLPASAAVQMYEIIATVDSEESLGSIAGRVQLPDPKGRGYEISVIGVEIIEAVSSEPGSLVICVRKRASGIAREQAFRCDLETYAAGAASVAHLPRPNLANALNGEIAIINMADPPAPGDRYEFVVLDAVSMGARRVAITVRLRH